MSFFGELKRRNVFRVGLAYVLIAWVLLQGADFALDLISAPNWVIQALFLLAALGLPVALIFSWVYEMTPEGLKRETEIDLESSITLHTGRKLGRVIIAFLVLAIGVLLVDRFTHPPAPATQPPPVTLDDTSPDPAAVGQSVAVLPFVNMSSDPENEYFADGLSEELLNQLAQIPDLQVAGRTSSFSFKGKNEDLRVIGAALGVANVLEGSVRRQGDEVRVTAQLIRVDDGFHLWSETYDRTMDDVFAIQDDISSSVANALKIILDESSRLRMQAAGVRNVDAFVAYQKGKELVQKAHSGTDLIKNMRQSLYHFDRAIELVPDFGAAYWQQTDYYAHLVMNPDITDTERSEGLINLRAALDEAYRYSSDPSRRAFIDVDRVLFSDDWTLLRDRIEKALATTGCPEVSWIELATAIGYAADTADMWARYQQCEPLFVIAYIQQALTSFWLGDFDAALEYSREAEVLAGSNPWIAANRQLILIGLGRADEALALAPEVAKDTSFYGMGSHALPLALSGDIEGARLAMERWQAEHSRDIRSQIHIYAAMGERARANELAAELDARPAGPMILLLTAEYCACGAPFDLEATPNLSARLREADITWPVKTIIRYPAKDW